MSLFFNTAKSDRQLKKLPIDKILPNPMQPRKHFDEDAINSLADSIAKYGIIQPVSVRIHDGKYELVAGERRLRAAKIAGYTEIPCLIIRAGERRSAYLSITENLQRCDLDMFEEAEAIERLMVTGNCTQSALAESLSMSQSALANKLRLLRFDAEQRNIIRKYHLSERHARALLRVPTEKRIEGAEKIGFEAMSVTAAEEYIDKVVCTRLVENEFSKNSSNAETSTASGSKQKVRKDKACSVSQVEDADSSFEQKPIRTVLIGDLTLFYNSLERSLSMLRNAGFAAELEKTENNGEVRLSIILKSGTEKQQL